MSLRKFNTRIKKPYKIMAAVVLASGLLGTSYAAWTDTNVINAVISILEVNINPDELIVESKMNQGTCKDGQHEAEFKNLMLSTTSTKLVKEVDFKLNNIIVISSDRKNYVDFSQDLPDVRCSKNCGKTIFEGFRKQIKVENVPKVLEPQKQYPITIKIPTNAHANEVMMHVNEINNASGGMFAELYYEVTGKYESGNDFKCDLLVKVKFTHGATYDISITTPSGIQVVVPEVPENFPVTFPEVTTTSSLKID